jgi:TPR repeat protein
MSREHSSRVALVLLFSVTAAYAAPLDEGRCAHGDSAEAARALRLYEQACAGRYAPACLNAALAYRDGVVVPKDARRASALLRRACAGGLEQACGH